MNRNQHDLPAPPRLLLWLAIAFFVLVVLVVIGAIVYFMGGQRLGALIPYLVVIAALVPVVSFAGAIIFRKRLPRFTLLWLVIFFVVLFVVGAFAAAIGYRDFLPPRYQEEVLSYAPFMQSLMRPTPAGGIVPTVASTSALSPQDLLAAPLLGSTDEPALAATDEVTEEPTIAPTMTPTQEATATIIPATATSEPTEISAAPTQALVSTAEEVVNVSNAVSRPVNAHMFNFRHERQDWNNCGPTNITMALSFYGWNENQDYAASFIRPNTEDKNVSPHELVSFVNDQTFIRAIWRIGGDMDLLKDLIAANFPVVIETGGPFAEGYDWIGHYQTVVGYDDTQRMVYLYDSYLGSGSAGEGLAESYDIFDERWQDFNRVFIVLYEPAREAEVARILGSRATPTGAAEYALATAQEEARANPSDPVPWFNIGTALVRLDRHAEAANYYDQSRQLGLPFRFIWYQFGVFEAYYETGRYSDVQSLAQSVIQDSGRNVEEAFYWQGRAQEALGNSQEAATSYSQALRINPLFVDAQQALETLNA